MALTIESPAPADFSQSQLPQSDEHLPIAEFSHFVYGYLNGLCDASSIYNSPLATITLTTEPEPDTMSESSDRPLTLSIFSPGYDSNQDPLEVYEITKEHVAPVKTAMLPSSDTIITEMQASLRRGYELSEDQEFILSHRLYRFVKKIANT